MSLDERDDVPLAQSRASTSPTRRPAGGGVQGGAAADDAAADDEDVELAAVAHLVQRGGAGLG